MSRYYLILVVCLTLISCKSKPVSNEVKKIEEVHSYSPKSTVIHALLLSKKMDKNYKAKANHPCSIYPCIGTILIQQIKQSGNSYHGQFNVGDTINAHFVYTLGNSSVYFKEKKNPPTDVNNNALLECIVDFNQDDTFIIEDHKIIKHD